MSGTRKKFKLPFHTPESFKFKNQNHYLCEKARDPNISEGKQREIKQQNIKSAETPVMPKEIDKIIIVEWDSDLKTSEGLFRYINDGKGYWCEGMSSISDGKWDEDNSGIGIALDLHNELYQRVNKQEAEDIAARLGGSIYED